MVQKAQRSYCFPKKRILSKHTPLFSFSSTATPRIGVFSFFFSLGGEKYETRVHSPSLTCPCRARACIQKLTGPQHTLVRDKKLGRMPFLYRRGLSGVFTCVCLACIYIRRCVRMFDTCTFAGARSPSCQFVVVLWIETEIRDILRVGKGRGPVVCSDRKTESRYAVDELTETSLSFFMICSSFKGDV